MNKAIFLDRDGVITKEKSYVTVLEELEIEDFAYEAIGILKQLGYKCIVITNQSAVAREMMQEQELIKMNQYLMAELPLDDIFYCPHLFDESIHKNAYTIECDCRKPRNGNILKAVEKYNIDIAKSYMVGDRMSDILAGKDTGIQTVLVRTGYFQNIPSIAKADFIFDHLLQFSKFL